MTLPISLRRLAGGVAVTPAEVVWVMRLAAEPLRLVVVPSGTVLLAAPGRLAGMVVGDGAADPAAFAEAPAA